MHDPLSGARVGRYLQFKDDMLGALGLCSQCIFDGTQPIALCEAPVLPLVIPELSRGRAMAWYVDNTSAMVAFANGASGNEHLERIVIIFWISVSHLG